MQKITGFLLLIFGLIYAVVGTLSLVGAMEGVLPGHENEEIIIIVLAYSVALLAIIGGMAGIAGKNSVAKPIGLIFAILGLGSLIYVQVTQDSFNLFDCIAMVLGVATYCLANRK